LYFQRLYQEGRRVQGQPDAHLETCCTHIGHHSSEAVIDSNLVIAGFLRDLASVQASKQSKWGYKRAASALLNLEVPIETLRQPDGSFEKVRHVGPASLRVIDEVLRTGHSLIVDTAVAAAGKGDDIAQRRRWQGHFLSRAHVIAALKSHRPGVIAREDCRADFQMHSTWSDGGDTLHELADGCIARGYTHCVITDHSHGLRIARGMSAEEVGGQHAEIDGLNDHYDGRFRIIKGIEANIGVDGSLDVSLDDLEPIELVMAAPHAALRLETDQTDRMLAVVRHPRISILGHGRGRMFGSRPGVSADWPRVFRAAADHGVAIEIDGDPSRQDMDYTLAREAVACGCLIALSSDAHGASQLRYLDTALAHARLADVPKDRVINSWSLDRLLSWSGERRHARTKTREGRSDQRAL
jgi:putative hydrolase